MSTYRVTDEDVKEIISTSLKNVTPFIAVANTMINSVLADDIADGSVSSTLLIEIEKWLAAHFVAIRDPRPMEKKTGEASVKYHGQSRMFLEGTPYGQQVLLMDPTGRLAEAGKGLKRASLTAIDFSTASD
jgi:hypothetical protein